MSYELRVARQAESYLSRLPPRIRERVIRRLRQIAEHPCGPFTKPLSGLPGRRAARVGGLRIVFMVDEEAQRIDVSDIGPRGDIYGH